MSILLFKTHTFTQTRTHTIFYMPSAHSQSNFGLPLQKRFIKTSKRMEPIISPRSFSLGRFLWESGIWISCVICIHVLSLAIPLNVHQALFFLFEQGRRGRRGGWCACVTGESCETIRDVNYNQPQPLPLCISLPLLHHHLLSANIPLQSLSAVSLACQMVLEWIPKS